MTTIGMYYDVIAGKELQFIGAVEGVIAALRQTTGHTESRLFEDVHQKGSYVILSDWESKASFDAFIASDAFKKVTTWGKENILRGRPKHKVYGE